MYLLQLYLYAITMLLIRNIILQDTLCVQEMYPPMFVCLVRFFCSCCPSLFMNFSNTFEVSLFQPIQQHT